MDTLNEIPWREQEELFEEISKVASVEALSEEERNRYDDALRNYRDSLAVRRAAVREGMEKGRKEEKFEIARNLKAAGVAVDIIVQTTGLTAKEIKNL